MSTTSNDPDEIRSGIERTRASLSRDVDALGEKVDPRRVVERQTDRVRGAVTGAKDAVFGAAEDAVARGTRGNPWAAGLVAFGLGLLASSLIPASRTERRLAEKARESEPAQQLTPAAKAAASDVGESLREPARHAVEAIKESAREGAEAVSATAGDAREHVVADAERARERVASEAQRQRP